MSSHVVSANRPVQRRVGGLPTSAMALMAATAASVVAIAIPAVSRSGGEAPDWEAFAILLVAASLTQLFAFHTIRNQLFHTTPLFFVAGAVLLPPELLLLLPLLAHIPDWMRKRYAWYIPTFNILNFTLAVMAAWWAAHLVADDWLAGHPANWAAASAAAGAVYVVVNNAGFAAILLLARGHSPRAILTRQVIAADAALASLGIVLSSFWQLDPWLVAFAVIPVFLLHQALHLPRLQ